MFGPQKFHLCYSLSSFNLQQYKHILSVISTSEFLTLWSSELKVKKNLFQNNNLKSRNASSNTNCIVKADVYFHGSSLRVLVKVHNRLPA